MALKFRRGSNASRQTITPAEGELLYVTDHVLTLVSPLWVGDGSTAGGKAVQSVVSINSQTGAVVLTTDNVTEGSTNKYYLAERAQDDVASLFTNGSHTDITFTYNDNNSRIDAAVSLNLNALTDVIVSSPASSQVLKYNGSNWVNSANTEVTPQLAIGNEGFHYLPFLPNNNTSSVLKTHQVLYTPATGTLSAPKLSGVDIIGSTLGVPNITTSTISAPGLITLYNTATTPTAGYKLISFGDNTNDGRVGIVTSTYTATSVFQISQSHNTPDAVNATFFRSRTSSASPSAVQANDDIIDISFAGYDGTSYQTKAAISATIDGVVSTGVVPTKITISTSGTVGTPVVALTVDSKQQVSFTNAMRLAVYADNTARDTAITLPLAGMMVFNTTSTKFQGYTGSAWVDLN